MNHVLDFNNSWDKLKTIHKIKNTPKDLIKQITHNKIKGSFMAYCFSNEYVLQVESKDVLIYKIIPSRFSELKNSEIYINKSRLNQCVILELTEVKN